ncbi:ExbD/TolR family protein [Alphaproteobacteria bacterium]|jgi:biopolymer transport protein TolR|nr:ExbD/TolR family protein [Alphaproteobacteria bacterium]
MPSRILLKSLRKKNKSINQINVTPFVDVMLVLLIVFMITAPLLTVGVSVDLPKTKAAQLNQKGDPIVISIKKTGDLYLQERVIEAIQLLPRLKAISAGNKNLRIYVRGDKEVPYGIVLDTISKIKSSGFKKVALVAKLKES